MCLLRGLRSFQRGTVGPCRSTGCKVTNCQSWRCEKNSADWPELNYSRVAWGQLLYNGIIFQLWQLVTLQPVDLQRPTVPFWKDLNLFNIQIVNSEVYQNFWCRFFQSKWPYLLHKMGFGYSQLCSTVEEAIFCNVKKRFYVVKMMQFFLSVLNVSAFPLPYW